MPLLARRRARRQTVTRPIFPHAVAAAAVSLSLLLGALPAPAPVAAADPRPSHGILNKTTRVAAEAAAVPSGFSDQTVTTGLNNPTMVAFGSDGRVFVSEKRGIVKTWATYAALTSNQAPAVALDIRPDVYNFWDRGLLGLAVDPNYPSSPYIFVLYTADELPGSNQDSPHWQTGSPTSDGDPCPNPPGATTDGCLASARLDRWTVNTSTGVATTRTRLVHDWCQQFPSHSVGTIAFGADGMLYAGAGEASNFFGNDWGQFGGTQPTTANPVTPANPCADPVDPTKIPPQMSPYGWDPNAEGGAMRAEDLRSTADATGLDGTIIRINPATGAAAAGNPLAGNAAYDANGQRIVAYGLRNPFRFAFRPGTSDLYIGDVGYNSWEELDRLQNPTATGGPPNYGWPCYEAANTRTYYTDPAKQPSFCSTLASGAVTLPFWKYGRTSAMAPGDGCSTSAGSSLSGFAFYGGTRYPAAYHGGLFVADYTRNCIVVLPAGAGGVPDTTSPIPFESGASNPVALTAAPDGDILYPDFLNGTVHRIRYAAPVAAFGFSPSPATPGATVHFDGSASSSPVGALTYVWNFDDGTGDISSGSTPAKDHVFAAGGSYDVRLTVTDPNGATSSATHTVPVGAPPNVTIDAPASTLTWAVGDVVNVAAHATDAVDGNLPSSAFTWSVLIEHCPSSCHEHQLTTFTGATGSFPAPDHDYPTWLHLMVTARDSLGLSSSKSVDIQPKTADVTVSSSPAGMPVSLGSVSGAAPVTVTHVVGSSRTLSATSPVSVGEATYAFSSWSDGGAASHSYTTPATNATVTATYVQTGGDAPDSCASASVRSIDGSWWTGGLGRVGDVDWYRFTLSSSRTTRIVLGNLPVPARLDLYSGCSRLLASSVRPGLAFEEIIQNLAAGSYAVRVTNEGAATNGSYALQVKSFGSGLALLSSRAIVTSSLRLVGEVRNNGTTRRGPVTVTARLYDISGHLLATRTGTTYLAILNPGVRSPFAMAGTLPSGFHHASFSLSGATTSAAAIYPAVGSFTSGPGGSGGWVIGGRVVNRATYTVRSVRVAVTLFDSFGTVLDAKAVFPTSRTLAAGATAGFLASFPAQNSPPNDFRARASATR